MSELITMPKLGFDMAEGTLLRWVKEVGEQVNKGDVLVEVETDKATVEVEAFSSGILRGAFVPEGTITPVGALIAVLGTADEAIDLDALQAQANKDVSEDDDDDDDVVEAAPPAPAPAAPAPAPVAEAPAPAAAPVANDGMIRISPVAQRMAMANNVNLSLVKGSGPQGRIVKRDIEAAIANPPAAPAPEAPAATPAPAAPAPSAPKVTAQGEDTVVELTRMRQAIARGVTLSKTTIPHFQVTMDINMAKVMDLRKTLNAQLADEGFKLSFNDFIVKACAIALRKHPSVNASYQGDTMVQFGRVNVGVAVSTPTGLMTVVVKDADIKALTAISKETREMANGAREGKVNPDDVTGATFTTSNLGMYGVSEFTAIITAPQSAILAIGGIRDTPIVQDGEIVPGKMMKVTISADHRVIDGALAAEFVRDVRDLMQNPMRMLV